MTSRLPPEVREQVLKLWLRAYSRDDIAENVGIGTGTVSEIIKDFNRRNPGFDLLREFVVGVKKEGTNVRHYAPAIRLQRLLESHSLTAEQIESLIASAAIHCFKRKEDLNKFIGDVNKTADLSNKTNVPVGELSVYILEKARKLQSLTEAVLSMQEEEKEAVRKCNAVQAQLEESRKHLVEVQEKQALMSMLDKVKWERDNLHRALVSCVKELTSYKFTCKYLVHTLHEANKKLSKITSAAQEIPRNQTNQELS